MKFPVVLRSRFFPPKPFFGISICGVFIFRREWTLHDYDVRHEHIHFLQQLEWLFVGFFILYHLEFLWHFVRLYAQSPRRTSIGQTWMKAYRMISFEREAYAHERDAEYLRKRRHWANYRMARI